MTKDDRALARTHHRGRRPLALGLVLTTLLALVLAATGSNAAAQVAPAPTVAAKQGKQTVAHGPEGRMRSKVVGHTDRGQRVTGTFTPLKFVKRHGAVKVRGVLEGVIHRGGGRTTTFTGMRTMTVKKINGTPARNGRSAVSPRATCDILHLVLAPLDLNLLGLKVHLDRVVLDIVAASGAGNLLGNLLCAVTGLLDGGLGGLLGRVVNLLNRILGRLGLGV